MTDINEKPMAIIMIGMAGTGKTTFINSFYNYLKSINKTPYIINLDPSVKLLPYTPNIDIRECLDYNKIRKDQGLGPNGAIVSCLNMFAQNFKDVIELLNKLVGKTNYVLIDAPGQLEVFKWSASGMTILESLSRNMPTTIAYLIDSFMNKNPRSFQCNMKNAVMLSVQYELPVILTVNKIELIGMEYFDRWINDSLEFVNDLTSDGHYSEQSILTGFALTLDEFFKDFKRCGVSAKEMLGFDEMLQLLQESRQEYFDNFYKLVLPKLLVQHHDNSELAFDIYGDINEVDLNSDEDYENEDLSLEPF